MHDMIFIVDCKCGLDVNLYALNYNYGQFTLEVCLKRLLNYIFLAVFDINKIYDITN